MDDDSIKCTFSLHLQEDDKERKVEDINGIVEVVCYKENEHAVPKVSIVVSDYISDDIESNATIIDLDKSMWEALKKEIDEQIELLEQID